jgi:hypothetical protein
MTHAVATSLLVCWASSATPDLTITKQKKILSSRGVCDYVAGVAVYGNFSSSDNFYLLVAK